MAVGLSLGFGVVRIINFAHGEMIMLGAYGAFWLFTLFGVDPLISLPALIVVGYVVGWLLFKGFIAKVLDAPHINQILLTFGLGLAIQHIAIILWTGNARSATPVYATSSFLIGDVLVVHGRLVAFAVAVVMVAALIAWLRWSETGLATRAVAENRAAATLMGVDVRRIYALSFGVSCALGVATGVVVSFILTITPFMGFPMLVKAIAIVILGGLGSIPGTVIGALVLAFAETFASYYLPEGSGWAEGIAFVLIIGILILRPRGILGEAVET
ncbi:MAG: branched-chain amino acid ABC transporter permease [Rhizobiales bacterium]|nr:branched-chain amino acid ABC transporter permease [Hyphomicrobiales bacterium]